MARAIELSRLGMLGGHGGPFGAVVVLDGKIVGEGYNDVTHGNDPTAHAEVVAIRDACRRLRTFSLEGAVIYSSCEPCPMCLSAIHWAHVGKIYCANTTADAARIGFDDRDLYAELALHAEERTLPLVRMPSEEAAAVFTEWEGLESKVEY